MVRRLRQFVESIVFAGLKPGGIPGASGAGMRWLGPLRGPVERFISGGPMPSDPLYLSNRTFGQKLKSWSLIGVPCMIVAGGIGLALSHILGPPEPRQVREPSAVELAAKMLPNMDPSMHVEVNKDIEVGEVRVVHAGGSKLTGTLKNKTTHVIASAEVVFDLTNAVGSQVGAVGGRVENLAPQATARFEFPINQKDAAFALVRDIRAR